MNRTLLADVPQAAVAPAPVATDRNLAIGYLRAFVTLLVLAHHSVIAYLPGIPRGGRFDQPPFLWSAFPVTDPQGWAGWSLLLGFNDIFFMSLMFFISGLFVPQSLARKGAGGFLRDRVLRLGAGFVLLAGVIAPLAYYPAYALRSADPSLDGYVRAWFALPNWNSGPAWFLGVLLALALGVAAVEAVSPGAMSGLGRLAAGSDRRPVRFFLGLAVLSATAYGGMLLAVSPMDWFHLGPFAIQASRILHYPLYFLAGLAVGARGLDRGLLAAEGQLARRWWLWAPAAVLAFAGVSAYAVAAYAAKGQPPAAWALGGGVGFALACGAACFALMAIFRRFVQRRRAVFDSLADNAYGMYLVHYAFASWLQMALLAQPMGGLAKGAIVTAGVVALSWLTAAGLRRLPGLSRIL